MISYLRSVFRKPVEEEVVGPPAFPISVMRQIIFRMDPKTLLKMECACKRWKELINISFRLSYIQDMPLKYAQIHMYERDSWKKAYFNAKDFCAANHTDYIDRAKSGVEKCEMVISLSLLTIALSGGSVLVKLGSLANAQAIANYIADHPGCTEEEAWVALQAIWAANAIDLGSLTL
jgi:hypothetical protein